VRPQLEDPSLIADSVLRARNMSLEPNPGSDDSPETLGANDENSHNKSFNSTISNESEEARDDDSGYANDEENSFTNSQKSRSSPVHLLSRSEEAEAEADSKSFSSFRFSSKLREGLDHLVYRATAPIGSLPSPSPSSSFSSSLIGKGSSNSLLVFAAKERSASTSRPSHLSLITGSGG
jgi:hypothetical protein